MNGRLFPIAQIEPISMQIRHDELAKEMLVRKMNHKSPFIQPDISYLGENANVKVDKMISIKDLRIRCADCRKKIDEYFETTKNF